MFLSVRVERVSDLPKGQLVTCELWPDGTVTYFIHEDHITAEGAEVLQAVLNSARGAYHQAWNLPAVATAASFH